MKVSIIIVSWNVRDLLKKCIESIFVFSKNIEFEVIVVDNASSDGTGEMVQKNFPEICFIQNKQNLGFATANNLGIEKAKGEYILLLNPDTEFVEDSLSLVVKKMESDKKIGVLGCKLINPDKTTQESVRRFPRIIDIGVIFFKIYKIFPFLLNRYLEKDFDYSKEQNVDQVMGAFFFVRGEVFDKIGPLDDKYFIWFEEVDFCLRAKKAGWDILYFPQTCVIHYGGKSFEQAGTAQKQAWFFKSSLRYLLKSKII
jgi:GT2 family glycosyltransferase